ncbi:MAG: nitroreductase family protein [Deltaproteobacteria bacterium]|nr:nitroreductase family protein [Deltaproteobacteria bacterium]
MEFKEVLGRRRSIRYFQAWRPVEREKVQVILEAARIASCAVNASYLRGIVVERDKLDPALFESIKTPVSGLVMEMAPLHIYFYGDLDAYKRGRTSLKELVDAGALNASHGWSHKFVDDFVWPMILEPIGKDRENLIRAVSVDSGTAICQALLAAFDEGLGACLTAFVDPPIRQALKVPDHWLPMWVMLVGYPAESWEAGGQRPRLPLEQLFFESQYGNGFKRDPKVVERLKAEKMLQDPAPLPWRKDEVRALARMFGLPE